MYNANMVDGKAAWRERTRSWALDLLGNNCARCKSTTDLQFDHVDASTKSFEISTGIRDGYSRTRLQAELLKCQLLCFPCHIQKSIECGDKKIVGHGGGVRGKFKCKCDPCRLKYNEYMRKLMRRKRSKHAALAQW